MADIKSNSTPVITPVITCDYHSYIRMEGNRLPVVALCGQVEGTRSRGRQPKKWIDNVKEDLTAQGMNVRETVDNSRNQEQKDLEKSC